MGFGPPEGDAQVQAALDTANARQAMTLRGPATEVRISFAIPASIRSYIRSPVEILYPHAHRRPCMSFWSTANWGTMWVTQVFSTRSSVRRSNRRRVS